MQAYQAALEEIAECHGFPQPVIVSISDDESGEDKEKVYGQIAVINRGDQGPPFGKREAFENMVEYYQ